jgi:hypothetical protein
MRRIGKIGQDSKYLTYHHPFYPSHPVNFYRIGRIGKMGQDSLLFRG